MLSLSRSVSHVAFVCFFAVQSLFPEKVKERLLEEKAQEVEAHAQRQRHQKKFREFDVQDYEDEDEIAKSKPLADLYPECTILFCDIVGFVSKIGVSGVTNLELISTKCLL